MDPERLLTHSLRAHPNGAGITRILSAALQAVEPYRAVANAVRLEGESLSIAGQVYDLNRYSRVRLVGAGKAAYPMAQAALDILGARVSGGLLITKDGHAPQLDLPQGVRLREAGHPVPDLRGQAAAEELSAMLSSSREDDLVLGLISGGGSALLPAPPAPLTLADLQQTTAALLACGAEIVEINILRKHLDRLKGGGMARLAHPAMLDTLVLSDVIGDPLDIIASGPTVPDPSTYADAVAVVDRYALRDQIPPAVLEHLLAGMAGSIPETPKPGDPLFEHVHNTVIASNALAARASLEAARNEGWHALLLTTSLRGEARQAGRFLAALAEQIDRSGEPIPRPACLVAGGETTVSLHGNGLGGRNQELALGAVRDLAGIPNAVLVALATDGGDGPTDAAGAVVDGQTLARAGALGLDPDAYLSRNDAYRFFAPLGDLLLPGPTRTNVNDLYFIFMF